MTPESDPHPNTHSTAEQRINSNEKPWSFWATIGWMALAAAILSTLQGLVLVGYMIVTHGSDPEAIMKTAESVAGNGLLVALVTCLTTPPAIALLALAAVIRWPGRWREYLALCPVPLSQYAKWLGVMLVLVVVTDALTIATGRSIVPQFSRDIYATAGSPALLWLALVVVAPVTEEIAFRGFMFRGLAASRIGALGAIALTSLVWAAIHLQYDAVGIFSVFVAGLVLGRARFKTDSTYIPMAMHCGMNLIAAIEAALAHNMGSRFPL